jgi:glucose 1-dehydrogenase
MLKGKCALVTGGVEGIGRGCVELFLKNGAKVVIADYADEEKREKALKELKELGEVWITPCQAMDPESVEAAVNFAVDKMGMVDISVYSVGGGPGGNVYDISPEDFETHVRLTLFGAFYQMRYVSAQMIKQKKPGSIITISSINSTVPYYQYGPYCASKAGLESMSSCAAMELGKHQIRVNSVCPGFTRTQLIGHVTSVPEAVEEVISRTPLNRLGEVEDVAQAVLYLASDNSSFVTGTKIVVDGGEQHTGYPEIFRVLMTPEVFKELYK